MVAITTLAISLSVPRGMAVPRGVSPAPTRTPIAQAVPFPTLYDDFHGAQIDPDRWAPVRAAGYEMSIGQDVSVGRLSMALKAYGIGPSPQGFINLGMTNPAVATAIGIQVTTRIDDVNTTGCASTELGQSRAGLNAPFFRDGPNPANPFDQTGVVVAVSGLRVFADQVTIQSRFFAVRCLDFNCNGEFLLGGGTFQDVALGQDATLGIELDAANNQIIFTKDDEAPQFVTNVSSNQINTDLGPLHFKRVQAIHFLETCPTQSQGFIAASFENFRIKP